MKTLILLLSLICLTNANIFDSLETVSLFDKQEIFYKSIIDEHYEMELVSDLNAYLEKRSLDTIERDSIQEIVDGEYVYPKPINYKVLPFALNLARHICINNNTCKQIIWKKRKGKKGYMQWDVARTVMSLFPDSSLKLLHEFKTYPDDYKGVPMHRWRTLSLDAVDEYSNNQVIDISKAKQYETILRNYQIEWRKHKKYKDTIVTLYIKRMYESYRIQKTLELDSTNEILKIYTPRSPIFERIIQNSSQSDVCSNLLTLINNQYYKNHSFGQNLRPIELVIKNNCKEINTKEIIEFNDVISKGEIKKAFYIENYPTPNLYRWIRLSIQK